MRAFFLFSLFLLAACGRGVPDSARIVVAGDSVMAWNRGADASVADLLQARLGEPIGDVSFSGAQIMGLAGALNIPTQLRGVSANWVVLNGGSNDLSTQCDCSNCGPVLDRLISDDGQQGAIPALVAELRRRGSKVIWADYYTAPRFAGTACEAPYQVLEDRLGQMAQANTGVTLLDMDDVFQPDDATLFAGDRLHPSVKGSARIADLIAPTLERVN